LAGHLFWPVGITFCHASSIAILLNNAYLWEALREREAS